MTAKSILARTLAQLAITAALTTSSVQAAQLVYSGVLEVDGKPANGPYDIQLTAFTSASGTMPKTAPVAFHAVAVKDGRFEVRLDLPGGAGEAWVELAVRSEGGAAFVPLLGRSKAALAPDAIGLCWSSTGDSGSDPSTNFLGTTDAQPLVLRTANARSLRIEPSAETFGSPALPITTNAIGGSHANAVVAGVRGATISGGGLPTGDSDPTFSNEAPNRVSDHFGTVAGGYGNRAGDGSGTTGDHPFATVGGGALNTARGTGTVSGGRSNSADGSGTIGGGIFNVTGGAGSTVGGGFLNAASANGTTIAGGNRNAASREGSTANGGQSNTASGEMSIVSGGLFNCAGGSFSWAGARRAKVRPGTGSGSAGDGCEGVSNSGDVDGDNGTFAWADSQDVDFVSTGPNQFLVRAQGGIYFGTNSTVSVPAGRFINTSTGAHLSTGGTWTNASSRALKEDFLAVDPLDVLGRVLRLGVSTWAYRESPEGRHMGPVAEDFHALFGLGSDANTISTVDASGVAIAAIQGLNQKIEAERDALKAENDELRARLDRLERILVERE